MTCCCGASPRRSSLRRSPLRPPRPPLPLPASGRPSLSSATLPDELPPRLPPSRCCRPWQLRSASSSLSASTSGGGGLYANMDASRSSAPPPPPPLFLPPGPVLPPPPAARSRAPDGCEATRSRGCRCTPPRCDRSVGRASPVRIAAAAALASPRQASSAAAATPRSAPVIATRLSTAAPVLLVADPEREVLALRELPGSLL
jgi:hypothetical protein